VRVDHRRAHVLGPSSSRTVQYHIRLPTGWSQRSGVRYGSLPDWRSRRPPDSDAFLEEIRACIQFDGERVPESEHTGWTGWARRPVGLADIRSSEEKTKGSAPLNLSRSRARGRVLSRLCRRSADPPRRVREGGDARLFTAVRSQDRPPVSGTRSAAGGRTPRR
jgi:hypothetical protein